MDDVKNFFKKAEKNMKDLFKTDEPKKFTGQGNVIGTREDEAKRKAEKEAAARQRAAAAASSSSGSSSTRPAPLPPATVSTVQSNNANSFQGTGHKLGTAATSAAPQSSSGAAAAAEVRRASASQPQQQAPRRPPAASAPPSGGGGGGGDVEGGAGIVGPGEGRGVQARMQTGREAALKMLLTQQHTAQKDDGNQNNSDTNEDIVHTLERSLEQVVYGTSNDRTTSIQLLSKILQNILKDPSNPKIRRLRLGNPKFEAGVMNVNGALEFLQGAGFELRFEEAPGTEEGAGASEGFAVLDNEAELRVVSAAAAFLSPLLHTGASTSLNTSTTTSSSSAPPQVYGPNNRHLKVFRPSEVCSAATFQPDDRYFNLGTAELRAEAATRRARLEESRQLTTRAFKERQAALRRQPQASHTTLRVRFHTGLILQGTFRADETVTSVFEFVSGCLADFGEFQLLEGGRAPLQDLTTPQQSSQPPRPRSLAEAQLVPSALLTFKWVDVEKPRTTCLRAELEQQAIPLE